MLLVALPELAHAGGRIRDAEVEHTLRVFSTPIFEAAQLPPESVKLFIINSPVINAFVAGGMNIFIHTGLIDEAKTPEMLIGVIAHETGHIAGGHLAQGAEKVKNAQLGALLSYVLGGVAAVSSGSSQAGAAAISASQQILQRSLLSFSRANENAADQAGLSYLETAGVSAHGFLDLLEVLRQQEHLHFARADAYTRTHPLSKERIMHIRESASREGTNRTLPAGYSLMHERMRAKLFGFLEEPKQTFLQYPEKDKSIPARIARAVAWHKTPDVEKALREVNALIAEQPDDPFSYDLKGQICFENNRLKDALAAYEKAVALLPSSSLIRADLARTQLALDDPALLARAVENLERSTAEDATHAPGWHLLATAYGKQGRLGESHTALGEKALLENDGKAAKREAEEAIRLLPPGSPSRLRAMDIQRLAEAMEKEKE